MTKKVRKEFLKALMNNDLKRAGECIADSDIPQAIVEDIKKSRWNDKTLNYLMKLFDAWGFSLVLEQDGETFYPIKLGSLVYDGRLL